MAKASDNEFPKVIGVEQASDPTAPTAGTRKLYPKADGWYDKDSAGVVTGPFGAGPGPGGGITPSFVQAYRNAALSIPSSTETAIAFDAEDFDADGFHDTAANPERFTVPAGLAGTYRVTAQVALSGNAGGTGKECSLALYNNGTSFAWSTSPMISSQPLSTRLDALVSLAAGDYVDLRMYQNGGSSVALYVTANRRYCRFTLARVA